MKRWSKINGPLILRIAVVLLFVAVGLPKLLDPSGTLILGLQEIGFPAPLFFGWLILIAGGLSTLALLFNWKINYAVWPLGIIMVGALIFIYIPQYEFTPQAGRGLFFHVLVIAALINIYLEN